MLSISRDVNDFSPLRRTSTITPETIMSQAALECEIQRGIERGWQVPRGENGADTTAIAVPTVVAKLRAAVPKLDQK
jgi:DNA-binding IclR family transcriptional regulator